MKKLLIIIIAVITIITVIPIQTYGQTEEPLPSITPTSSPESKDIDKFKEKLASQVAKLTRKDNKAIAGIVEKVEEKKVTIKTELQGEFVVGVDPDLTKFYQIVGITKQEKPLTTLKKGAYIIVRGPVADDSIEANVIYQDEEFLVDAGKIVGIEAENSSLEVVALSKENYTLTITRNTKQQIIDIKTLEFGRATFTNIKSGDNIHFVVKKAEGAQNKYEAVRILIIPQEYFIK